MRNDYSSNYLAHWGIPGMKWYQRRYQNEDGSLTAAGRERYGVGKPREKKDGIIATIKKKSAEKKRAKQRKKALDKAREARKKLAEAKRKEEEFKKKKEQILRSGDAKQVLKYRKYMTDQEIKSAAERIKNEGQLEAIAAASQKSGFEKIDKFFSKAQSVTNWTNTAMKMYNQTADLYNTFLASDENDKWEKIPGR